MAQVLAVLPGSKAQRDYHPEVILTPGKRTRNPHLILPQLWEVSSQPPEGICQFTAKSFLTSEPREVL